MEKLSLIHIWGKRMNHNTPLTPEQRELAARYHQTIYSYLRGKRLDASEWYDVAVFGYLRAVRLYTTRPELRQYSFTTIAGNTMDSEIDKERRKQRRRIQPLSLDAEMTEDGLTLYDVIGDPQFLPYQREDEVVAASLFPALFVDLRVHGDVYKRQIYYNVEDGKIKLQPIAPDDQDYDGERFTELEASALDVPEKLIELGLYPAPGYDGTDYFLSLIHIYLPIIMIVEYIMAMSVTMLSSAFTVYLRDVEYILGIISMA